MDTARHMQAMRSEQNRMKPPLTNPSLPQIEAYLMTHRAALKSGQKLPKGKTKKGNK